MQAALDGSALPEPLFNIECPKETSASMARCPNPHGVSPDHLSAQHLLPQLTFLQLSRTKRSVDWYWVHLAACMSNHTLGHYDRGAPQQLPACSACCRQIKVSLCIIAAAGALTGSST